MSQDPQIVLEPVNDPAELAEARLRDERFRRNLAWFEPQAESIYEANRGRCICIAGQEVFSADTSVAAIELARQAHPEDDGFLMLYVPFEKMARIYASAG